MKTKMKTFIGLVALTIIGFTGNATAANNLMSSYTTVETEDNFTIEDWMLNSNLWFENSETKAEKAETEKPLEIEEWMTDEDFIIAAETYTASGSDKEIEKYANRQIENSVANVKTANNLDTNKDFFRDAESYTASGSDKEIEKYADQQIALENEKESR
ncbi:MAG: hypothetical protein ACM3O8_06780 [Methylococcaceae bacterium]